MSSRQGLLAVIRKGTSEAINAGDERWGRMLATVLEKRAIALRLTFGGKTLLGRRDLPSDSSAAPDAPEEDWNE